MSPGAAISRFGQIRSLPAVGLSLCQGGVELGHEVGGSGSQRLFVCGSHLPHGIDLALGLGGANRM